MLEKYRLTQKSIEELDKSKVFIKYSVISGFEKMNELMTLSGLEDHQNQVYTDLLKFLGGKLDPDRAQLYAHLGLSKLVKETFKPEERKGQIKLGRKLIDAFYSEKK